MTNPNCRVLIFSILRFISTKCCKTQNGKTTVLAFINSLCRHDLGIFWKTPFESLKFFFDEATIEFRQTISYKEAEEED